MATTLPRPDRNSAPIVIPVRKRMDWINQLHRRVKSAVAAGQSLEPKASKPKVFRQGKSEEPYVWGKPALCGGCQKPLRGTAKSIDKVLYHANCKPVAK